MQDYLLTTDVSGKYIVRTLSGFNTLIKPSEVKNIISDLKYYCKNYTDEEVDLINANTKEHFFDNTSVDKQVYDRKQKAGYIYLLKCGEFYKIGYSKCVEQRIHQLDVRPYKINLLMKWKRIMRILLSRHYTRSIKSIVLMENGILLNYQ